MFGPQIMISAGCELVKNIFPTIHCQSCKFLHRSARTCHDVKAVISRLLVISFVLHEFGLLQNEADALIA